MNNGLFDVILLHVLITMLNNSDSYSESYALTAKTSTLALSEVNYGYTLESSDLLIS